MQTLSLAELLASLPDEQRETELSRLSLEAKAELRWRWEFHARPNQLAPDGDWSTWLALAGRGFGKTEAGAQWIRSRVKAGARSIALIAETQKDLEEVMVARLMAIHPPAERPIVRYKPVRIIWPNGAMALGYNGTEPDQLRGPEFDTAWIDELAKYHYAREVWDMLQFTMRRGENPQAFVTTTPRPIPVLREIVADPRTVVTRGSTFDNASNLPAQFLANLRSRYEGTRLGRQELNAEILDDLVGALWTADMIEAARWKGPAPDLIRVVIGVDPSGSDGETGDSQGIVVAGIGRDHHLYVLADLTCRLSPEGWARTVAKAAADYGADRVIAERNFGGAMVESVLRAANANLPVKLVTASRGKFARAEPIAAIYEQGRGHHVGAFPELEAQMGMITTGGFQGEGSPDRLDALVWASTELMLENQGPAMWMAMMDEVERRKAEGYQQ